MSVQRIPLSRQLSREASLEIAERVAKACGLPPSRVVKVGDQLWQLDRAGSIKLTIDRENGILLLWDYCETIVL